MKKFLIGLSIVLALSLVGFIVYNIVLDLQVTEGIIIDKGYVAPYTETSVRMQTVGKAVVPISYTQHHPGYYYIEVYNAEKNRTRLVSVSNYYYLIYKIGDMWYEDLSRSASSRKAE